MPDDPKKLPQPDDSPRLSDGREHLGEEFRQPVPREDRQLGGEFADRNTYDGRHLGQEFSHADQVEERKLGQSFNDPNSLDDTRLGKEFEQSNSSARKHHRPLKQVVTEPFEKPKNKGFLLLAVAAVAVVFLLILFLGWIPRHREAEEASKRSKEQTQDPLIEIARVQRAKDNAGLVVPGTTTPLIESSIYARATGFLKKRYVDLGDHVKKGQLLALVDAPDLDAQVTQARQQVVQAEAQLARQETQLALTKVTVDRYRNLVVRGVFSRQDGDQAEANYQSQIANVAASERNLEAFRANLARNVALQGYERITAPFDGIVTQRNVENGDLIQSAGSSGGTAPNTMGQSQTSAPNANAATNNYGTTGNGPSLATPSTGTGIQGGALFTIAQNNRLRILVSVPEGYATQVHTGQKASLKFQEFPTQSFFGDVTRTAGSVDQNTRTMIAEIQIDNSKGQLLPGMYAVATFSAGEGPGALVISTDCIGIRNDTTSVALIQGNKVHLVPVSVGRDFGPEIEIVAGLHEGDLIASTFTDAVKEGARVRTQMSKSTQDQQPTQKIKPNPPGGSTQYGDPGIIDQDMQGQSAKPQQKKAGGATKCNNKSGSTP